MYIIQIIAICILVFIVGLISGAFIVSLPSIKVALRKENAGYDIDELSPLKEFKPASNNKALNNSKEAIDP